MITTANEILQESGHVDSSQNWDGVSKDFDKDVPNKETGMEFAEHQRIVLDARKLLCSFPKKKLENCGPAEAALWHLGNAYFGSDTDYVVSIAKGIHQPSDKPHIQLKLYGSPGRYYPYVFHLNLSAGRAIKSDDGSGIEEYFYWEGAQFTVDVSVGGERVSACWPLSWVGVAKRERRKSVCFSPDLEKRINEQNEAIALEEEKAKAAAALKVKEAKDRADAKLKKEADEFIASGGPRKATIKKGLVGIGVANPPDSLVNSLYSGTAKKRITFSTANFSYSGVSTGFVEGAKISFSGNKTAKKGSAVSEVVLLF